MIAPKSLADTLVSELRLIDELVREMGGDANSIWAYEDKFPESASLFKTVATMPGRQLMVVWNGTQKSVAQGRAVWLHKFSLIAKEVTFSRIWELIANGTPPGRTQNWRYAEIYPGCYPVFADIGAERKTLFLDEQSTLDYLEVPLTMTERGGQ